MAEEQAASASVVIKQSQGWHKLFPTPGSFVIFVLYMVIFISQTLLVAASKGDDKQYRYNTVTVVLLTELLKLIVSVFLYLRDTDRQEAISQFKENVSVLALYLVPSALYCLYNNLTFINLSFYDPATYALLLQFRVVVTGVIFQLLFKKRLSGIQWMSLFILTGGCILKQAGLLLTKPTMTTTSVTSSFFSGALLLILLQVFSSCFAGVYNEYLLKKRGVNVPLMLQNIFMYLDSVLCNGIVLAVQGKLVEAFSADALTSIVQWNVLLIICSSAAGGIVTSLFLHSLNSILKTFASALDLIFTPVLAWLLLGIPLDVFTVTAIAIICLATWLYARNPVQNNPTPATSTDTRISD